MTIPETLIEDIGAGRCVAFVGAGFTAAARLPTWTTLLREMATTEGLRPEVARHVRSVVERDKPSAHELDEAAQLVEDSLGRPRFIARLRDLLQADPSEAMQRRLRWLRDTPFRAIVTTNFDTVMEGMVPGPDSYHALLRPTQYRWWERAFWGEEEGGAPILKIHGDIGRADAAETVVLTRRDYRRRLYTDPGYMTFLRSLLSTNSVLFLGVSFQDAYLNELRSQVLALFDYDAGPDQHPRPLAYAVLADVPELIELHFERHEGIGVLGYDSGDPPDFGGFDAILEAIWRRTALLPRFGRLLAGRRLLWLDPQPHNNEAGYRFLERAVRAAGDPAGCAIEHAATVEAALARLSEPGVEIAITHWGWGQARDDRGRPMPNAVRLLERMRELDVRCPVIVFSRRHHVDARKRRVLSLGAQAYCFRWQGLFRTLDRVLGPAD